MRYIYNTNTGELIGWLEDGRSLPADHSETDLSPEGIECPHFVNGEWVSDTTSRDDARKQELIDQVWNERQRIANDPRYGVDPVGASVLTIGQQASNVKAIAVGDWAKDLHAEAMDKETSILAGDDVDPYDWTTSKEKPFSISEIAYELGL